eukprot:scaffold43688_cov367-Amphora_coffeaeformis.AAC.2
MPVYNETNAHDPAHTERERKESNHIAQWLVGDRRCSLGHYFIVVLVVFIVMGGRGGCVRK